MPINDAKGWYDAYDISKKYFFIKNYLINKSLMKLKFYNFVKKENTILDVACGDGNVLTFLKGKGYSQLFGFDIREYKSLDPEIKIRKGDMLSIPFPNKFANCLLCFNAMHHLLNYEQYAQFILECKRVLKEKGHLFLVEPENNFIRKLMYIVLAIPIINNIEILRLQKKAVDEEEDEIELFYKLDLPGLLSENLFNMVLKRSYLKSILIHAQLK